jgi:hypothetical protein
MKTTVIRTCQAAIVFYFMCNSAIAQTTVPRREQAPPITGEEHVIGACRFHMHNLFAGYLSIYNDGTPPTGIYHLPAVGPNAPAVLRSFGLNCWSADDRDIGTALGAKKIGAKWLQYDPSVEAPGLTPFDINANPQTVTFKGKNWTGVGLTIDATTGDEEKRPRVFSFCLIHNAQALCGDTPVEWLADPKHNDLWKVKSILQSVVFSDASAAIEASGASASAISRAPSK